VTVSDGMLTVSADRRQCSCGADYSTVNSTPESPAALPSSAFLSGSSSHASHTHSSSAPHTHNGNTATAGHHRTYSDTSSTSSGASPKILHGMKVKDRITQSLLLPAGIAQDRVKVTHDDGILRIELPKSTSKLQTSATIDVIDEEDELQPSQHQESNINARVA
jgi:hypothetical protein